jgi:F-type H+-transporting ATPase subunit beta
MAEQFRDQSGTDVLFFVDNIFRFTQAGSEVSALLGRIPSAVGYQPTLATDMGALQERITSTKAGSITSCRRLRAGGRPDRPGAGDHVCPPRRHHGSVARDLGKGHLPGRGPARLDLAHARPAMSAKSTTRWPATCRDPAALQVAAGHHRDPRHGRAVGRGQADRGPRPQDPALPVAAVRRGRGVHRLARVQVPLDETIASFKAVVAGEYDHLPEGAFYMVGGIDEVSI